MSSTPITSDTLQLLHDHWQLTHIDPTADPLQIAANADWRAARVPGNVQASAFGLSLDELYRGDCIHSVRWMEQRQWVYRRSVAVPVAPAGHAVHLTFHGLDYRYRIFVNQQLAKRDQGMFTPVVLDLSLHAGKNVDLLVAFDPPPVGVDPYVLSTKAQFNRGWDFAPAMSAIGIWNDVTLNVVPELRVEHVYVDTHLDNQQRAHVTVRGAFSKKIARGQATIELCGSVRHVPLFDACELSAPIEVESPELWWPVGLGKPALHDLRITLEVPGESTRVSITRIGLREITRIPAQGQRPTDFPLQWVINGTPVFLCGVNWVPPEVCTGEITAASYEKFLPRFAAGGVNVVRVWGGGLTEKKPFYDRCDELGLMVMQEFPIACGMGWGDEWLAQLQRECISIARKIRQHPSVVVLTGGNENYHFWEMLDSPDPKLQEAGEQARRTTNHNKPWNRQWVAGGRLQYDEPAHLIMGSIAAVELPHCLYQNTSAMEGEGEVHGIWTWDPQIGDHRYRMHGTLYDYWLAADQNFYSEASVSSIGNLSLIRHVLGDATNNALPAPSDPIWKLHHGLHAAWDNYEHLWFDRPGTEKVFGPLTNLSEAVTLNQYLQAEGARFMIEELRRKQPHVTGVIWWGVNEPWPSLGGNSLIDYFGEPKLGWKFFTNAIQPVILSLRYTSLQPYKLRGELWLTCNAPAGFEGTYDVTVQPSVGEADHYTGRCAADYGQSQPIKPLLPVKIEAGQHVVVRCVLRDEKQQVVHENVYRFGQIRELVLKEFAAAGR